MEEGACDQTLRKKFPRKILEFLVQTLWRLKSLMKMADLGNHFYVVRMFNKEEYERVFGGPWLLVDHYITVQKWYPDFNCDLASLSKILI